MSSLYSVIPEFEPLADSLWTDFSTILVGKVHPLSTVEFSHLQYTQSFFNSSISLRVLFVEELFPDSPILHGARLALSRNSHIFDSLGRVPSDENEFVGLIRGGPCLQFLF